MYNLRCAMLPELAKGPIIAMVSNNSATASLAMSEPPTYRNNLPRHLIALSRFVQSSLLRALQQERGHAELIGAQPYAR